MIGGLGGSGEKQAEVYLKKNGYSVITKNFRCRFGEIDIIAFKNGVTIFAEVKTRSSGRFGFGFEAVDRKKQQKMILTAGYYFSINGETPARFDVISIDKGDVTHIENAFGL